MATEQEHPSSEQSPEQSPVAPKKAAAKENLAFLTSGAKEKLDKTFAGMKGASQMMKNPFNKQAREDAKAQTAEEKNAIADKQERIRQTAHMQHVDTVNGFEPLQAPVPGGEGVAEQPQTGDVAPNAGDNRDSAAPGQENENQDEISPSEPGVNADSDDKIMEDSSDDSSRARHQIPPDSKDYQSG